MNLLRVLYVHFLPFVKELLAYVWSLMISIHVKIQVFELGMDLVKTAKDSQSSERGCKVSECMINEMVANEHKCKVNVAPRGGGIVKKTGDGTGETALAAAKEVQPPKSE